MSRYDYIDELDYDDSDDQDFDIDVWIPAAEGTMLEWWNNDGWMLSIPDSWYEADWKPNSMAQYWGLFEDFVTKPQYKVIL